MPWNIEVNSHHHLLTEQVRNALKAAAPKGEKIRKPWLDQGILNLVQKKRGLFKRIGAAQRQLRDASLEDRLRRIFEARLAKLKGEMKTTHQKMKSEGKKAWKAHLTGVLQNAKDSLDNSDSGGAFEQLRRLRKRKPRPTAYIKDENGVYYTTYEEVRGKWLMHWKQKSNATETTFEQMLKARIEDYRMSDIARTRIRRWRPPHRGRHGSEVSSVQEKVRHWRGQHPR
eukprot:TRINITY_DN26994_c0_g1_i1.p2 TRINITY_DN26994_c0_g1~~TRINITY_DN26994_c0_g1_i1.p2  ORF type:complete len:228 (+),score=52.92 TRINITY_DN26994_c0_g1_i1:236-919(+)